MNDQNQSIHEEMRTFTIKKNVYKTPALTRFGSVQDLTNTGSHPQHLENSGADCENNALRQLTDPVPMC